MAHPGYLNNAAAGSYSSALSPKPQYSYPSNWYAWHHPNTTILGISQCKLLIAIIVQSEMPALSKAAHSKSIWNTKSSGTYQPIMSNPIISMLIFKQHVIWWVCPILWYSWLSPSDRSTCFLWLSWHSFLPIFFILAFEDLATPGRPCGQASWMDLWHQVWISSCSGCVTDALMVFSHPSGQAHSFCHSTSSMVTAALSAPTLSYLPKWHSNAPAHVVHQKSMQILCHMFGSYIALISTHIRLFTHCPQTQSGQCYYSQCPNTDLLQSSLNVGDPVVRRGPYEWCCLPYTANRSIVTCDSTLGWGTWYFLSLLLILWPLCRLAASLPTGAPTDYTTYIQILTFQFTDNAVSIQHI